LPEVLAFSTLVRKEIVLYLRITMKIYVYFLSIISMSSLYNVRSRWSFIRI